MLMTTRPLIFTLLVVLLASCRNEALTSFDGEAVTMHYATLLKMTEGDGCVVAEIRNPWSKDTTAVLHRYVLVEDKDNQGKATDNQGASSQDNLPEGEVIHLPLKNIVVYTSVHASLITQLGGYDAIRGVCDSKYMYLQRLQQDIRQGKVIDCGEGSNPDLEKVIDLNPRAILLSPFENSGSYGRLGKLGIPIIECADYMENSALGRAEWMRFYGVLIGHRDEADSLFSEIEHDYNATKDMVKNASNRPTVVMEKKMGDAWYVPGNNSTVGGLLADAGADYIFCDEKVAGSIPMDPEKVFDRAQQADLWLIKYNQAVDLTYSQLADEWGNYKRMKPFMEKNIYSCNLSQVPFYEETPFHPNLLLKDYVKILHPDVLKDHSLRYYKKVKE